MFIGSIDLSKIDKNRIVTTDKDGNPFQNGGKYYNIVMWLNDEVDQYGNIGSIQEGISKEEREGGMKSNYIGNFKNVGGQNVSDNSNSESQKSIVGAHDDDMPF